MNEVGMRITIILIGVMCLAILIINIVAFCGLGKQQKKEILKTHLKGLLKIAMEEYGEEILQNTEKFEKYFKENSPIFYKILILFLGKDSLADVIEEVFSEIESK